LRLPEAEHQARRETIADRRGEYPRGVRRGVAAEGRRLVEVERLEPLLVEAHAELKPVDLLVAHRELARKRHVLGHVIALPTRTAGTPAGDARRTSRGGARTRSARRPGAARGGARRRARCSSAPTRCRARTPRGRSSSSAAARPRT